ncbi:hypothetical protein ACWGB8_09020 [Kitasatospora sp. NPDC054939]
MSFSHVPDVHAQPVFPLWSLREDVALESTPDEMRLDTPSGGIRLPAPGRLVREMLWRMSLGPVLLENVVDDAAWFAADRAEVERVLGDLGHLVVRSLGVDARRPLLSVVPDGRGAEFRPQPVAPDVPVRLSRHAALRTDGRGYLLESPRARHRVELHRPEAVQALAGLATAVLPSEAALGQRIPPVAVFGLLSYLAAAGMVVTAQARGGAGFAEDAGEVPGYAGYVRR